MKGREWCLQFFQKDGVSSLIEIWYQFSHRIPLKTCPFHSDFYTPPAFNTFHPKHERWRSVYRDDWSVNPFRAGTVFMRQNLTSVDVRFWRVKTVPTLKELRSNWEKHLVSIVYTEIFQSHRVNPYTLNNIGSLRGTLEYYHHTNPWAPLQGSHGFVWW